MERNVLQTLSPFELAYSFGRLAHAAVRAITRIVGLLSLILFCPAAVQAQDFTYIVNSDSVTITGYVGAGGEVVIPDNIEGLPVTIIGTQAFIETTTLTSLTIGNNVTTVGDIAFLSCTGLMSVTIPESVKIIGVSASSSCTNLTGVTIPDGVISIGNTAFFGCTSLASVKIGSSVTTIGNYAFVGCGSLTHVTIPDSVTTLGGGAFEYCTSLRSITIGDGLTTIPPGAFFHCTSLTKVSIPDKVNSIGNSAFEGCTSLTSVAIPDSVVTLGDHSFASCRALTSVTIGSTVIRLGEYALSGCPKLEGAYFRGNASPLVGEFVFLGSDNATVFYLPGTTGWGSTLAGRPTVLWNPTPQITGPADPFVVTITGSDNLVIVVEAATSLANPDWTPVSTNTLTDGSSPFSDPQWMNHPARYYRLRSP